jgi:hypothetical protein
MYIRATEVDKVTQKTTNIYGFHTNTLTKGYVIDNYIAYIEDSLYVEPDKQAYDELLIYERKEDGTMGNVEGKNNHDDIVMSTGIGLYVSQKMPKPTSKSRTMKEWKSADIQSKNPREGRKPLSSLVRPRQTRGAPNLCKLHKYNNFV